MWLQDEVVDYTKCALYDRYDMTPDWKPFDDGFKLTTDQIPTGLQCTTNFPDASKNAKIFDGVTTERGTYPWQVRLKMDRAFTLCSGSIIDDTWIVTSAYCCGGSDGSFIEAYVGDWKRSADFSGDSRPCDGNCDPGEFIVRANGS